MRRDLSSNVCVCVTGEETMTKEEYQKMKQELEA